MPLTLSDLISNDLSNLAYQGSDVVASEEAIRLIVDIYKQKEVLTNISIVRKDKFYAELNDQILPHAQSSGNTHYQFIIEVGSRSLLKQGDPASVHYCALDLYFFPDRKPIALVADHYRGYDGYYEEFKYIANKLKIDFAIAGGSVFQADQFHCPIFSIHHLLQSAKDPELPGLLKEIVPPDADPKGSFFNWARLAPNYVVLSQSVGMLFKYVDTISQTTQSWIPRLDTPEFRGFLESSLYPIQSLVESEHNKIRNRAVKKAAAHFSGIAVLELEALEPPPYTEEALLELCYSKEYPLVHKMLAEALATSRELNLPENQKNVSHPLFDFVFYYAEAIEKCLNYPEFSSIYNNQVVLKLMANNLIEPRDLFKKLILTDFKEVNLNKVNYKIILSNIPAIELLYENLDKHPEVNKNMTLNFLSSKYTLNLLKDSVLKGLFSKGFISMSMVNKIQPFRLKEHSLGFYVAESDEEKMQILNRVFKLDSPSEIKDDFFSMPQPSSAASSSTNNERPKPSAVLISQSMCYSFLSSPSASCSMQATSSHIDNDNEEESDSETSFSLTFFGGQEVYD